MTRQERDHLDACLEIRRIVFIVGQDVPYAIERDSYESSCGHLLVLENSTPVGTLRYRATQEGVKLERIAVLPEHHGKGYGRRLVEAAIHHIHADDGEATIYLHAQVASEGFYKRLGFVDDGGPIFKEAGIEHRTMVFSSADQNSEKE